MELLVGSKGFGGRVRYRNKITTYLSSIRASRLAWPHLRLWSLPEHFLVMINPARNPTRIEMMAVLTQAMDRVCPEYSAPPDLSKGPSEESNEYFLCLEMGLLRGYLFWKKCLKDLLSRGDDNTSLGLTKSISSSLDSWLLLANCSPPTKMKKILELELLVTCRPAIWEIWTICSQQERLYVGSALHRVLGLQTEFMFPQLIKMFAGKCFRCNLPEYEEDEPHPEWNPPAMFCSKELASSWLPWWVWQWWVWVFQAQ